MLKTHIDIEKSVQTFILNAQNNLNKDNNRCISNIRLIKTNLNFD